MLGDNAYDDGTDAEYERAVFEMYPSVLRSKPLWSTRGNYDDHLGDDYLAIFTHPTAAEAGDCRQEVNSFDHGNIHFLCLNSNEPNDRAMLGWLRHDPAATRQRWTIAFWHHPPYSRGSRSDDRAMKRAFLPLLEAAVVDLVLAGRSHSYERSFLPDGLCKSDTTKAVNAVNGGNGREAAMVPIRNRFRESGVLALFVWPRAAQGK